MHTYAVLQACKPITIGNGCEHVWVQDTATGFSDCNNSSQIRLGYLWILLLNKKISFVR